MDLLRKGWKASCLSNDRVNDRHAYRYRRWRDSRTAASSARAESRRKRLWFEAGAIRYQSLVGAQENAGIRQDRAAGIEIAHRLHRQQNRRPLAIRERAKHDRTNARMSDIGAGEGDCTVNQRLAKLVHSVSMVGRQRRMDVGVERKDMTALIPVEVRGHRRFRYSQMSCTLVSKKP